MTSPRYRHKADYLGHGVLRHPDGATEKVSYVINHYLTFGTVDRATGHGQDLLTGRIRPLDRPTTVAREEFLDDARWGTLFTLILSEHGTQLPVRLQADGQIIPAGGLTKCA